MSERPEQTDTVILWHALVRYTFASLIVPQKRVLDLACANGLGTVVLAEQANSVVGADVAREVVQAARQWSARPNVRFEHVEQPPFPFPDASFDVIVSLETIEHMARDAQPGFIAELDRLLAPDGVLILSTPDAATEEAQAVLLGERNPWHIHTPPPEELKKLLERYPAQMDFVEVDLAMTAFFPPDRRDVLAAAKPRFLGKERHAPISRICVASKSFDAIAPFRALKTPIIPRHEPRLALAEQSIERKTAKSGIGQGDSARAEVHPSRRERRPGEHQYTLLEPLVSNRRCLLVGSGHSVLQERSMSVVNENPNLPLPVGDHAFDFVILKLVEEAKWAKDLWPLAREMTRVLAPDGVLALTLGSARSRAFLEAVRGELPYSMEILEVDLVATAILPDAPFEQLADIESWTLVRDHSLEAPPTSFVILASRSSSALDSARSILPLALVRGDFQRRALWSQLIELPKTPDLSALALEDRVALLTDRATVQEQRTEALEHRVLNLEQFAASVESRIEARMEAKIDLRIQTQVDARLEQLGIHPSDFEPKSPQEILRRWLKRQMRRG